MVAAVVLGTVKYMTNVSRRRSRCSMSTSSDNLRKDNLKYVRSYITIEGESLCGRSVDLSS